MAMEMQTFPPRASRGQPSGALSSPNRITTPAAARLSVIPENNDVAAPQYSSRSSYRSPFRRTAPGAAPSESADDLTNAYLERIRGEGSPPPPYDKLHALRNNKYLTKRGGWKRFLLIFVGVLLAIIAIVVGVTVGLANKSSTRDFANAQTAEPSPFPTPSTSPAPNFPAGSYSLPLFLDEIVTNCTSNPATWNCYPYTTYADSPTNSRATFQWIISSTDSSSQPSENSYIISSTPNPLTLSIPPTPLRLDFPGLPNEAFSFWLYLPKEVTPRAAITDDGGAATCYYARTTFKATLYTKMPREYPPASKSGGAGEAFPEWPFAVSVGQVAGGDGGAPECYRMVDGRRGERVEGITAGEVDGVRGACGCSYKNYLAVDW